MKNTWQVVSSNGELQVNMNGVIVGYEIYPEGDKFLKKIWKFDMNEYEQYSGTKIQLGDSIDILLLGYWYGAVGYITSKGREMEYERYEPAVEEYRNEVKIDKI